VAKSKVEADNKAHPYAEKTIIAFDQSTGTSGYAVFRYGSLEDYGVIEINKASTLVERVWLVHDEVKKLMDKWKPDLIAIEDGVIINRKGALSNANAVGGLMMAARPTPVIKINNKAWKKGLLGKTKRSDNTKELARLAVNRIWKIEIPEDYLDVSDAVGILTYVLGNPEPIPTLTVV
jgi:Holliday junction resolvasome RuvABC endonuclease subunit